MNEMRLFKKPKKRIFGEECLPMKSDLNILMVDLFNTLRTIKPWSELLFS